MQKEGIVDAVLSEDVDTMMFGCTMTLKNWTAEGRRGNKTPTHVNVFTAEATKNGPAGLDSEGMILIALMSGGDYITAGIPGCGPKIAAEAARAGFGRDLCGLSRGDAAGLQQWRERLEHELHTNESKYFGRKHKAISIPESFPDKTVFGYYTHPVVSPPEKVARLRREIAWDTGVSICDLRQFVAEAFNWPYLSGAKHFIRGLAPALLVNKLVKGNAAKNADDQSLETKAEAEARLVKTVSGKRAHWITDGAPELRIAYVPADIVGLDLDAEERDDYRGLDDDDSGAEGADSAGESRERSKSPTKRPFTYDPTQSEKIWVLETHVKLGVPLLVETWEEDLRNPKKFASRKAREKTALAKATGGMVPGTLDQFFKVGKPGIGPMHAKTAGNEETNVPAPLPPFFLAPDTALAPGSPLKKILAENTNIVGKKAKAKPKTDELEVQAKSPTQKKPNTVPAASPSPSANSNKSNPWTLSKRPSDTYGVKSPSRYSALGIYAPGDPETLCVSDRNPPSTKNPPPLASPPATPSASTKHTRSTSSTSSETSTAPQTLNPSLGSTLHSDPKAASTLATPPKDPSCHPSPRKKRSPLQQANALYLSGQLKTPTTSSRISRHLSDLDHDDEPVPLTEAVTLRNANRRLLFNKPEKALSTASDCWDEVVSRLSSPLSQSEAESLPSPSSLMSPTQRGVRGESVGAKGVLSVPSSPTRCVGGKGKRGNGRERGRTAGMSVALRESLEGAWKVVEPWEVDSAEAKREVWGSVEVVDLTGSC